MLIEKGHGVEFLSQHFLDGTCWMTSFGGPDVTLGLKALVTFVRVDKIFFTNKCLLIHLLGS